jgi:hypothetical protein
MASKRIPSSKYRGWAARVLSEEVAFTLKQRSRRGELLRELLSDSAYLYFVGKLSLETLLGDVYFWCRAKKVAPAYFINLVTVWILSGKRIRRVETGRRLKHGVYFNKLVCDYVNQARDERRASGERGGRDEDCKTVGMRLKKEFGETLTPYAIRNIYQRQKLSRKIRKRFRE